MRIRRPRGLSPEDEDLWHRVAGSVTPLHPRPLRGPEISPAAVPKPRHRMENFEIGTQLPQLPGWTAPAAPAPAALRMDAKTHARMRRGKLAPEARIDLHGMTLAEAHPRLNRFVSEAHAAGMRLVLVITGKGRGGGDGGPISQHPGVLKGQVPHWLALPPLGAIVLQVTEAHLRHGGSGAYYVYLRRAR